MQAITIGLDIAKSVFQVHGEDASGKIVIQKRLRRSQMAGFFAKLAPARVGIEACGTAHYWGRSLRALGHEVRLIPAAYVKPFVKRNKTDARDAAAICTALGRPDMRFVAIKSAEQQAARGVERARELPVKHVMRYARSHRDRASQWQRGILARRPVKIAVLAQAAKTARIAWAMLVSGETYRTPRRVVDHVA